MGNLSNSSQKAQSLGVSLVGKAFSSVITPDVKRFTGERRYRIKGSGVQHWPSNARLTEMVVAVLREHGIAVREYSMGSPGNVDSFHLEAKFKDGGLTASTGTYWYGERGVWITGDEAVTWVGSLLGLRAKLD